MSAALIVAIATLVTSVVNGIALLLHINTTVPPMAKPAAQPLAHRAVIK